MEEGGRAQMLEEGERPPADVTDNSSGKEASLGSQVFFLSFKIDLPLCPAALPLGMPLGMPLGSPLVCHWEMAPSTYVAAWWNPVMKRAKKVP